MFATTLQSRAKRRGIVLVLVLGMLGLMALIGVTFATFAGQSMIASRNFSQGVQRPQAEALMDYALAQLINDTNNPLSSIRGHGLLRDMYGNDSVFRGANPTTNAAAETGGLLALVNTNAGTQQLFLANPVLRVNSTVSPLPTPFYNQIQYTTNIPTTGQYYGLDFTRWIVRFPNNGVPQTFEVLEDDAVNGGGVHLFTLASNLVNPYSNSSDSTSFIYVDPNLGATVDLSNTPGSVIKKYTALGSEVSGTAFVLDGRYMRAFNGPGLTQSFGTVYPNNLAAFANMRIANLDPDSIGMDEDYDACDLENWFLAIQSADGQVVIPSFHRPGILMAADWLASANAQQRSKILRPRQTDNSPLFPSDPSAPDTTTGKLTYDIDNDGDGVTDSVWVDLGYPVQRDPLTSKLYKPLFAFMVLGLNGRLPLNTVGNLQARAVGDKTNTSGAGQSGTASSLGAAGNNNADATVQVPYPGYYASPSASPDSAYFIPQLSSQVYLDAPLWDHASHLGYSVNEINPKFALQNAPSNLYPTSNPSPFGVYPFFPFGSNTTTASYSQYDNFGISVALTQMRNILAGTDPTDIPNPISTGNLSTANPGALDITTFPAAKQPKNNDNNVVLVDGNPYVLPNNVADTFDWLVAGNQVIFRNFTPVAGRWGEIQGVPQSLPLISINPAFNASPIVYPSSWYTNPVRAGRSYYNQGTTDVMDDDFDALDPYLPSATETASAFSLEQNIASGSSATQYQIPLNLAPAYTGTNTFTRYFPESVDFFDAAGQMGIPSERIRRFTTPIDPAGTGRLVGFSTGSPGVATFLTRPTSDHDFGNGPDAKGRLAYFRYFRPAGMPQEIRYPYSEQTYGSLTYSYPSFTGNPGLGQQYLIPVLLPAGQSSNPAAASVSDVGNNQYHGYQAALTPTLSGIISPGTIQNIAPMGVMSYNWDMNASMGMGGSAAGYAYTYNAAGAQVQGPVNLLAPTINPTGLLNSSSWGPIVASTPANYVIAYSPSVVNGFLGTGFVHPISGTFYPGGGSLNIDEADEMNLYAPSLYDQPYGPSDLEWLYRLQDVDGATLSSRLSKLAPISFLNAADGTTRRRLFSTDSWELNRFAYANDNPNNQFPMNSRFLPNASPSLENMNQVVAGNQTLPVPNIPGLNFAYANPIATEFLPNPTLPPTSTTNNIESYVLNSGASASTLPLALTPHGTTLFTNATATAVTTNGAVNPLNTPMTVQVQTPSIAHGDRKINLNFPLPIANDPAEPVRQKWCRETYQMLKAILPPASIDTPEELAALSQFVVNIVDFRDTDCTMTRFVNTDLEVTDVLTKQADNIQHAGTAADPFDLTWSVSPAGVKFAKTAIPTGHFPYDPSIYSPDTVTSFLVQHGMEYNPIALNEVMAYQAQYGNGNDAPSLTTYQAMFIELVNTLTEEFNNGGMTTNSSAISLAGWDIVIAPDDFGWGRPDPISGDVNSVAWPPWIPNSGGNATMPPLTTPAGSSQRPNATTTDTNLTNLQTMVQWFSITNSNSTIKGINSGGTPDHFVIGDYRANGASVTDSTTIEGTTPVAKDSEINVRIPLSFQIPTTLAGKAQYYWVYLRRPANPFDISQPNQVRPNKEMVVVDSMRFPVINAATETLNVGTATTAPTLTPMTPVHQIYSAQRLQPYRGGHLVRVDTVPPSGLPPTMGSPASGVGTICPPSPAYAYGYSEQMATPPGGNGQSQYKYTKPSNGTLYPTKQFQQSINNTNGTVDTNWSHLAFNDRDFTSVAELLLVPGCPPGLFTKQFVEEQHPGNIFSDMGMTAAAAGTDDRDFAATIVAPVGTTNPSLVGRKDFSTAGTLPANATFPYLSDNFYYTAASVSPPTPGNSLDANYTTLTTEIGGWTGAGWHKMLEFFEVPSSANGATGFANNGNNYDWYRADVKPGLINLNLIIDEEVFAGLIDDQRLNEILAYISSSIPAVVTQIDGNGYPVFNNDSTSTTYGLVYGAQPMFSLFSSNPVPSGLGALASTPAGRGYVLRDPDVSDYAVTTPQVYPPQQLHGMKAAFADFLKLRHGGSGFLFAFGNGQTGSGDYPAAATYPVLQGSPSLTPYLPFQAGTTTQPVAAERPYRSLSYPDINFTVMRPASLPPSQAVTNTPPINPTVQTNPPVPVVNPPTFTSTLPDGTALTAGLQSLGTYAGVTNPPYVQLQPALAPRNQSRSSTPGVDFQYVFDPGLKNPYLPIQFVNQTSPQNSPAGSLPLAPPYATPPVTTPPTVTPAPFPPSIPPTPARRLFQVPDHHRAVANYSSNASLTGQVDSTAYAADLAGTITNAQRAIEYTINRPTITQELSTGVGAGIPSSPSLVVPDRAVFLQDNYTPQLPTAPTSARHYLGAGSASGATNDYRQHPLYRTEWLQKVMNLTTVRTHQFAVWITVGFFEVVRPGTPELGIPDVLGQEVGLTAGKNVRYRSFFTLDRTKATGFNPYYPGNFRDVVTYRRRIE